MTGYNLVIGVLAIIVLIALWIPLNEGINGTDGLVDSFNAVPNITQEVKDFNTSAGNAWYYILFIFIIIIGVWIVKSATEKREAYLYG